MIKRLLLIACFAVLGCVDSGFGASFVLKHESGKTYGPFQYENGAEVAIGKVSFTLSKTSDAKPGFNLKHKSGKTYGPFAYGENARVAIDDRPMCSPWSANTFAMRSTMTQKKALLRRPDAINAAVTKTESPLYAVCMAPNSDQMCRWLIENGADVNKHSVLIDAMERCRLPLPKVLVDAGADVNAPCKYRDYVGDHWEEKTTTPLAATLNRMRSCVRNRARMNAPNKRRADECYKKYQDIAEYLESQGAKE